jgi:hypothetical protein
MQIERMIDHSQSERIFEKIEMKVEIIGIIGSNFIILIVNK